MNEPRKDSEAKAPTPEQLAGRQLRLLRQGRGWSQLEVAERMGTYGYQWSQATVTRLEAATRPIRLNELTDLAALYGVPVTQLLESGAPDDLEAVVIEIDKLSAELSNVEVQLQQANAALHDATDHRESLRAHLARIEWRLGILTRWYPAAREAQKSAEGGSRR